MSEAAAERGSGLPVETPSPLLVVRVRIVASNAPRRSNALRSNTRRQSYAVDACRACGRVYALPFQPRRAGTGGRIWRLLLAESGHQSLALSHRAAGRRHRLRQAEPEMTRRPLIAAGLLLGIGLGGFVDGIVFHQLLQLHNMLSAVLPTDTLVNAKINMVWDGVFHLLTWLMTVLGIATLWRAGTRGDTPWSGRTLVGAMLNGWGTFNLIEGVIDHHILGIHHVVERLHLSGFDYAFLAAGLLLMAVGWLLLHASRNDGSSRRDRPASRGPSDGEHGAG
jgi:uncharacterized membrane protein